MFEEKRIETKLINGKKCIAGAVWKWGPMFATQPNQVRSHNKNLSGQAK